METQAEVRYDSSVIIGYNIGSVMMESGTFNMRVPAQDPGPTSRGT